MNGTCVYAQLMAQMYLKGYDSHKLAERTRIPYTSLRRKLRGEVPLKLEEAFCIQETLECELSLNALFERREAPHDR